jgi:flavin reductase (DIM6/NTAB) family NADH-FMN oxidoreductase RutF
MTMNFWIVLWKPQLIFTGVSIMRVNPETGKFCAHIVSFDIQPAVVILLTGVYHPKLFDNLFHHGRFSLSIIINLALWLRW